MGGTSGSGDDSDEYQQGASSGDSEEDEETSTAALIRDRRNPTAVTAPQQSTADNAQTGYATRLAIVVGVHKQRSSQYWNGPRMLLVAFWSYRGHDELGDIQMAVSAEYLCRHSLGMLTHK